MTCGAEPQRRLLTEEARRRFVTEGGTAAEWNAEADVLLVEQLAKVTEGKYFYGWFWVVLWARHMGAAQRGQRATTAMRCRDGGGRSSAEWG